MVLVFIFNYRRIKMNKNNNDTGPVSRKALAELQEALQSRKNADRAQKTGGSTSTTDWEKKAEAEIAAANADRPLTPSEKLEADAESKLSPEAVRSMSESFRRRR